MIKLLFYSIEKDEGKIMLVKRINDGNGGEYIVVVFEGKVFLGHETRLSNKGSCSNSD